MYQIDRIKNKDTLFFKQLLTPICNPRRSTIENDPRMSYYDLVAKFSSMKMAAEGGSYSNSRRSWTLQEMVNGDGIVIHNTNQNINKNLDVALVKF